MKFAQLLGIISNKEIVSEFKMPKSNVRENLSVFGIIHHDDEIQTTFQAMQLFRG